MSDWIGHLHVQLVRRLSPHHVLDHEPAARVFVLPAIEPEYVVLRDDEGVAGGDEAFDLTAGEDTGVIHGSNQSPRPSE